MENEPFDRVLRLFPQSTKEILNNIPCDNKKRITEIRLRLERQLTVSDFGKEYGILINGELTQPEKSQLKATQTDIETVMSRAFKNSIYSYKKEFTSGFITSEGGCRVGFCGTAALNPSENYRIENIRHISSVNIRIAREVKGCADSLINEIFKGGLKSLLIAGAPASGKTTVLRDLTRQLGSCVRISLIDERNEIAACINGVPQNDVGLLTDVFSSYGRYDGIITAVRVMSPRLLVCDEIGTDEDHKALEYAINSGVKILASCHADSFEELQYKPVISKLIKAGVFDFCAFLSAGGKVQRIDDLRSGKCLSLQGV